MSVCRACLNVDVSAPLVSIRIRLSVWSVVLIAPTKYQSFSHQQATVTDLVAQTAANPQAMSQLLAAIDEHVASRLQQCEDSLASESRLLDQVFSRYFSLKVLLLV